MVWGNLDEVVISGHDNGDLAQWDLRWEWHCRNLECLKLNPVYYLYYRTGKKNNLVSEHAKSINDMQLSKDGALLITASKDCTAKLFNAETLECLKTYKTERPVNSAAISPIMDHVWSLSF
jgi:translation initiation factor 3 subunit I